MAHSWKLIGPGHVCSGRTGPNVSLTKTLQYSHTLMITGMGRKSILPSGLYAGWWGK